MIVFYYVIVKRVMYKLEGDIIKLNNYIGLEKKDILSIVGAGGKTSTMFKLAEELRENNKVLVVTTTKIYVPPSNKYDFICTDKKEFSKYANMKENGIYVLGTGINKNNKILELNEKGLDELSPYFDYILIEADGAKKKQLKGWSKYEPVIYGKTTKTIGIIDIQAVGMVVSEDKIHRSKIFCEITGVQEGDKVTIEHLSKLIIHPQGLFKKSQGERILFINKTEEPNDLNLAKLLVNEIDLKNKALLDKVCIGSLKNNTYF